MRMPAARTASSTGCVPIRFDLQERARLVDRTVDVRFGGRVDHRVDAADHLAHEIDVVDVAEHEGEPRIGVVLLEVRARPADRQTVEHGHACARLGEQRIHQVGTDEAGATGDEDVVGGHRRPADAGAPGSLAAVLRRTAQHGRGLARASAAT